MSWAPGIYVLHNHASVKACCFCGHKLDKRVNLLAYVYENQATACDLSCKLTHNDNGGQIIIHLFLLQAGRKHMRK